MNQAKLSLKEKEYKSIKSLIANKFGFDKMVLIEATSQEEITLMEAKLDEAGLLYAQVQQHPQYLTQSTAKRLVGFIRETQKAYKRSITILHGLGEQDTREFEEELGKAAALHEKINEFLIDCMEDY